MSTRGGSSLIQKFTFIGALALGEIQVARHEVAGMARTLGLQRVVQGSLGKAEASNPELQQRLSGKGDRLCAQIEQTLALANREVIIGVIDGVALQTHSLALNAAVEAARAGEQGRRRKPQSPGRPTGAGGGSVQAGALKRAL